MSPRAEKPLFAIVGRPNVGKSTLFNRLVGRKAAIVLDSPGVTRDRNYADGEWDGRAFTLVDTGGFVPGDADLLLTGMREQARFAIEEADAILFAVDALAGLSPVDQEIALLLRKSGKPVILAVNKMDGRAAEAKGLSGDFYRLGFERIFSVSAEHGLGIGELLEGLFSTIPEPPEEEEGEAPAEDAPAEIRVAIVGRPNVGKSTLINALLKEDRFVASALPGTTRDALDAVTEREGRRFVLTDTAGIRKKATIVQQLEKYAVVAALRAVEKSDVAVLVIDASEGAVDQDARIAQLAEEKGRALMICVNKWDLVPRSPGGEDPFRASLKERFKFVGYAPMVFTSALQRTKVDKLLDVAGQLYDELTFRAPTPQLNRLLARVQDEQPAPIARGRPLRLYYIAQVSSAPPTFAVTTNYPREVPDFYRRFLVNQIRAALRLRVPIRILLRERPGRAKREARKRKRSKAH